MKCDQWILLIFVVTLDLTIVLRQMFVLESERIMVCWIPVCKVQFRRAQEDA